MLVNAISKLNTAAVRRMVIPSRGNANRALPKYSSVDGIGMGYAVPIMGVVFALMGVAYAISPFQNRAVAQKVYTDKYQ